MKNLVFQINIKPNNFKSSGRKKFHYSNLLYDFSNQRAKEYANKFGADYFCLDNTNWLGNDYAPTFHKLYIYELFKKYDKIFYLDSDAIITKICPNIFEYHRVSAVVDDPLQTPNGRKRNQRKLQIHKLPEIHKYFCAGVILLDKEFMDKTKQHWREELQNWKDVRNAQHDQSVLNVLVSKYYGGYNNLNYDWGAHWRAGKYVNHHAGPRTLSWTEEKFLKWESKLL
tara:strand:+ start:51 stop:731 length:681 start_codon:yes stop_codon:yes gene_type:complete